MSRKIENVTLYRRVLKTHEVIKSLSAIVHALFFITHV